VIDDFNREIERRRREALARIDQIPIASLIWGGSPSDNSPYSLARRTLRDELTSRGHLAHFSEDLLDHSLNHSLFAQQISHAEAYDIVFSIPASFGSVAEIHDFARIPWLSHKIVTFVNNAWDSGYSNQTLIQLQSNASCQIQKYEERELPSCIIEPALSLISRLQEIYYSAGRRY
jgi:hypothetical protein